MVTEDGRLVIEGEDYGDKDAALAQGAALSQAVRLWHGVAKDLRQGVALT